MPSSSTESFEVAVATYDHPRITKVHESDDAPHNGVDTVLAV